MRGKVPSYLGSSFSFIAVVGAAYRDRRLRTDIPMALGGIIAAGAVYAIIGLIVMVVGYKWVEWLMPPVITGAIVMVIGLNLAHIAVLEAGGAPAGAAAGRSTTPSS